MRLSSREREVIVSVAEKSFGPQTRVVLFGSRTSDLRRGGDIDLLILGPWKGVDAFQRKIAFLVGLKMTLGDQHIDVVLAPPQDDRPIVREAIRTGVEL